MENCPIAELLAERRFLFLKRSIHAIYRRVRSVQNKSNEDLFKRAAEKKYGDEFPSEINNLLKAAYEDWFPGLRLLRNELTHKRVGICAMQDDFRISYTHYGLGSPSENHIEDIIDWINIHINHVNVLLNEICKFWFDQLEPREVIEICGFHQGRVISRAIKISEPINQDSGLCLFRHAFEKEPEWACPLRDSCGAYERAGLLTSGSATHDGNNVTAADG